ncbi:T-cell-specific surface glycoprotein CD28 [Entelurus aequoreus]|uniref:T-cell-specific surface glycoprotein CD28 n=1 Tax=Entelurus aequoreus TaxID=161455 RepID=UPI002B1E7653|nr:T-cell-specific surface glycoprotein CD28 [Entelurus aequoreus]
MSPYQFKMSVWVFVIFLVSEIPPTTPAQSNCPCKYELKAVCSHGPATVFVPCPKITGEDVTFWLLKDEREICKRKCSYTKDVLECEPNPECSLALREANESVSFILTGDPARTSGLYMCEGMVTFPPPFKMETSAMRILVHVEGRQCQDSPAKTHLSNELLWILIAVLGILCVYSVTITTIAGVKWANARREHVHNVYSNTTRTKVSNKKNYRKPKPQLF